jgi:hypothetical protein
LGLLESRFGVLKVLFSSQYFCHFGSTSAKGYVAGAVGDCDSVVAAVLERNRLVPKARQVDFFAGRTKAFAVRNSNIVATTHREAEKDMPPQNKLFLVV